LVNLARWLGYLALSWLILRPALLITISLDDFINPFYVYDKYGSNPWHVVSRATRDVFRNGHFNVIGQVFGAAVFASWNYLISWGVRYSLIYATTKFVVIVGCALAGARLLRTLAALVGRPFSVWRARVVVAAVLLPTLQLHVPWGLDPVGSFPLYGYLPAALGLLALDVGVRALQRDDVRSALLAAAALCAAILYYEINVAMVAALVPVVVLLAVRLRRAGSQLSPLLRQGALVGAVPAVMTLVLIVVAKRTNQGYTGTDVDVGATTVGLVARTVGGSLPASAWGAAQDWLGAGGSFGLAAAAVVSAVVVGVAMCWAAWRQSPPADPAVRRWEILLVTAVPIVVWLAATLIQTVTSKVNVDTVQIGYVYTYYAYGSVGIALALILATQLVAGRLLWRRARPVLVAAALVFVVVQMSINDTVTRAFDERLAVNSQLLVAVSSRPAEPQRCDALRNWLVGTFFLPDYYHQYMVDGLDATYEDHFGERFCDADVLAGG
ncbi:MAG: hypothetical protein JWM12_3368, partial [Ilumatobacteraceae bacterium]|nr:hypothetical protein [Ilumatobacteraceae bacterium]